MHEINADLQIDMGNFKAIFKRDGSNLWLEIKSQLINENMNGINYKFIIDQSYQFEIRKPNSEIITSTEKAFDAIHQINEAIKTKVGSSFYLHASKKTGVGSIDLFSQHIETALQTFAVEVQCKLHFANGYKNDHIVYINHLIPISEIKHSQG
jgi:hypothetical protein